MEKEKEYFRPHIEIEGVIFTDFISELRKDGAWGGNNELTALSGVFNCVIEVYQDYGEPRVLRFSEVNVNTERIIRLLYKNVHYSIIRSDGFGHQLFNFEGLEEGELERQMELLNNPKIPENDSELKQHSSIDDQQLALAIKLSIAKDEAQRNYLRFYASRITK